MSNAPLSFSPIAGLFSSQYCEGWNNHSRGHFVVADGIKVLWGKMDHIQVTSDNIAAVNTHYHDIARTNMNELYILKNESKGQAYGIVLGPFISWAFLSNAYSQFQLANDPSAQRERAGEKIKTICGFSIKKGIKNEINTTFSPVELSLPSRKEITQEYNACIEQEFAKFDEGSIEGHPYFYYSISALVCAMAGAALAKAFNNARREWDIHISNRLVDMNFVLIAKKKQAYADTPSPV